MIELEILFATFTTCAICCISTIYALLQDIYHPQLCCKACLMLGGSIDFTDIFVWYFRASFSS